jgi:hypothetical protein
VEGEQGATGDAEILAASLAAEPQRAGRAAALIDVDGCLNPPEFGDMGSAAVAGSD